MRLRWNTKYDKYHEIRRYMRWGVRQLSIDLVACYTTTNWNNVNRNNKTFARTFLLGWTFRHEISFHAFVKSFAVSPQDCGPGSISKHFNIVLLSFVRSFICRSLYSSVSRALNSVLAAPHSGHLKLSPKNFVSRPAATNNVNPQFPHS